MVTLDARRPGVRVPTKFKDELQLNLDFSTRFAGVQDLEWDEVGVRSTLTFGGQPFFCDVPWSAVWAMRSHVDNQMMLWPEDLPEEMLAQIPEAQMILKSKREDQEQKAEEPPEDPPPGKGRPGLRLIK
jgi:stringent starvation protein B